MKKKGIIYLDYAAATPIDPEVQAAMEPWTENKFCNPSATYTLAHEARKAIDDSRSTVAQFLHCEPREVIFTSGGTESDNLAVLGVARTHKTGDIILSIIEHPAVLEPARQLLNEGFTLRFAPVQRTGLIILEKFEEHLRRSGQNCILTSVMLANNEIGTIQPVAELVSLLKKYSPAAVFHTDACQIAGFLDLDVKKLEVDLLTINSNKIYGPRGVGALFVRRGLTLSPLMFGGHQEYGLRPGTENTAAIVGFSKALEICAKKHEQESIRLKKLRDKLIEGILKNIPYTKLNGDHKNRLPNNVNILFNGIEGEALLFCLDDAGICASMGSACASGSLDPSPVLLAIGLSREQARSSIRFTLGRYTTDEEIDYLLKILPQIIAALRSRN